MAIMHPADISKRKHVPSEEKFFNACKNKLNNKYHVFFSVRWYSADENGKRIDSECDFLIFNPDYGFLCVECKGGKGIYVDDNDIWYLAEYGGEDRKLKRSPYKQAEESMRFFKKYYEDELETFFPGIYGCAAAFPNFCVSSPITVESPLVLTIDKDGVDNLQKRIIEIFRYFNVKKEHRASFMSPDSQRKFIGLINKRIALSIAAGALIEDKARELAEINHTQDVIIDLLMHYPRAFIIGGAGTGKTWIGIKKIIRCICANKTALYVCCNRSLADYVKNLISDSRADVFCIDDLAYYILGEKVYSASEEQDCKLYADLFDAADGLKQYDLVIVDEAQDFTEDWAYSVNLLVKSNGSLYVFYDESQNIFSRSFGDRFYISSEPFVLRYNIRNTSNIYQYTQNRTTLGMETLVNQIEGVEPVVRVLRKKQAVISFVDSIVNKLINKEGISPKSIALLSNKRLHSSVLEGITYVCGYKLCGLGEKDENTILFSTVEEFKGLESDIIIYINHIYKNEPDTQEARAINYTALTRARFYLYVIDYELKV